PPNRIASARPALVGIHRRSEMDGIGNRAGLDQHALPGACCGRPGASANDPMAWATDGVCYRAFVVPRNSGKPRTSLHVGVLANRDSAGLDGLFPLVQHQLEVRWYENRKVIP